MFMFPCGPGARWLGQSQRRRQWTTCALDPERPLPALGHNRWLILIYLVEHLHLTYSSSKIQVWYPKTKPRSRSVFGHLHAGASVTAHPDSQRAFRCFRLSLRSAAPSLSYPQQPISYHLRRTICRDKQQCAIVRPPECRSALSILPHLGIQKLAGHSLGIPENACFGECSTTSRPQNCRGRRRQGGHTLSPLEGTSNTSWETTC